MRAFSFLVSGKIPNGDEHMNLLLTLLRIVELIFAPKITRTLIPLLQELINNFPKIVSKY